YDKLGTVQRRLAWLHKDGTLLQNGRPYSLNIYAFWTEFVIGNTNRAKFKISINMDVPRAAVFGTFS
ncbi:hypothetical protein B0H17DRAFT_926683, partial [Mycena rosella]